MTLSNIAFDPRELADRLPEQPLPEQTWDEIADRLYLSCVPHPYETDDGRLLITEVDGFAPHEDNVRNDELNSPVPADASIDEVHDLWEPDESLDDSAEDGAVEWNPAASNDGETA